MFKRVIIILSLISSFVPSILAQSDKISGNVKDESNVPLVGVSVMIKGTTTGTMTDYDGNFSLPGKEGDIIQFSFTGMVTEERVFNGNPINILMKEDANLLKEVVVVGYGTQKKTNLTGSVASVDFEESSKSRPVTTVANALSGAAAGLNVMTTGSKPNEEKANISIRGIGTLNNSGPLVLVDGMEMEMNQINPNDVANISILKDAASSAIYGNRAANGVILITTKQGNFDGKLNVTYSGKFSYNTPANWIHQISNYADYMDLFNEAAYGSGTATLYSTSNIEAWRTAEKNPDALAESGYPNKVAYPNTDWYDVVYNPKWMQEHTMSVVGSEKRTRYSLTATYLNNPGIAPNSGMQKYYVRSNVESKITSFITAGIRAWGYHADQERNNVDELNGIQTGLIRIGTFSSVATHWLPRVIKEFQKDFPNIEYEMLLGDYTEIEEWIATGRVDCGFLRLPTRSDFDTMELAKDELMAIIPVDHPFAQSEVFPVEALGKEPFMLLEKGGKAEISAIFQKNHITPDVKFTTWDDYAIMSMVEQGLGISILPSLILKRIPYNILAKPLDRPAYRTIGVAMKNRKTISAATKKFLEYLPYIN